VIGCFVDIGGIADHHCLNFLFIIVKTSGKMFDCFDYYLLLGGIGMWTRICILT
jgi:hypothetical protein